MSHLYFLSYVFATRIIIKINNNETAENKEVIIKIEQLRRFSERTPRVFMNNKIN